MYIYDIFFRRVILQRDQLLIFLLTVVEKFITTNELIMNQNLIKCMKSIGRNPSILVHLKVVKLVNKR